MVVCSDVPLQTLVFIKKYCFHLSHLSRCDCLVGLSCLLQKNTMLKNNIYLQSVIANVDN